MTKTRKIFDTISKVDFRKLIPKAFNTMILAVSVFMMFGVFNAYAVTVEELMNTTIDVPSSYQEMNKVSSHTGNDDGPNTYKMNDISNLGSVMGVLKIFTGPQFFDPEQKVKNDPDISALSKGGLIGYTDSGIVALYRNQPGVDIPNHMAKQWVPGYDQTTRSTIAAEDGYDLLTSVGMDELWEKTRLIAYVLFVLVLMSAGFMIMFRQKIGGQLMITVFNTLPGVIVGLIVVTFSFAIVGLILNLGILLVGVIGSLLDPSGQSLMSVNGPFSLLSPKNIAGFFTEDSNNTAEGFTLIGGGIVGLLSALIAGILGASATVPLLAAAGPVIAVGAIGFFVVMILVVGIVLWASVKVYITVLTAYIGIILDTVLGPLYLVASALPGKSYIGFDWFKRILRNALAFPMVFFFVNLGGFILKHDVDFSFPPGLVGNATGPVDGALNFGIGLFIKAILAVILFFVAAESPKFLLDILPTNGGKGAEGVMEGTKRSLSKIPLVGGFFG